MEYIRLEEFYRDSIRNKVGFVLSEMWMLASFSF